MLYTIFLFSGTISFAEFHSSIVHPLMVSKSMSLFAFQNTPFLSSTLYSCVYSLLSSAGPSIVDLSFHCRSDFGDSFRSTSTCTQPLAHWVHCTKPPQRDWQQASDLHISSYLPCLIHLCNKSPGVSQLAAFPACSAHSGQNCWAKRIYNVREQSFVWLSVSREFSP